MSGLDKIKSQILEDAKALAASVFPSSLVHGPVPLSESAMPFRIETSRSTTFIDTLGQKDDCLGQAFLVPLAQKQPTGAISRNSLAPSRAQGQQTSLIPSVAADTDGMDGHGQTILGHRPAERFEKQPAVILA